MGFPGGSAIKNPPANAGDSGLIPGMGRSPGEGNGKPLQYPCLPNPVDRGTWKASVNRAQRVSTTEVSTHNRCTGLNRDKIWWIQEKNP